MGRLINQCRWSSSRESTFSECRKKYWYSYYGAWEGWPKTPYDTRPSIDPLAQYLYTLKNMQPLCMFMGSAVHKTIEWCLKKIEKSKEAPPIEVLHRHVAQSIETGIADSISKRWKNRPKHHTNLLEHYYGLPFSEDDQQAVHEKALLCITNWYSSACFQKLALNPKSTWLGIEVPHTFALKPGIEAIVVYDFFLSWPQEKGPPLTIIFDWKTGKRSPKVEAQLLSYALAAHTLFHTPYDALILSPFYLSEGPDGYQKIGVGQAVSIDTQKISAIKEQIIASAKEMLFLHPEKDSSGIVVPPDPAPFVYTENRRSCQRCPFQEVCQKAQYQPLSSQELRENISLTPV